MQSIIQGLLLAAGGSVRFGGQKLLQCLPDSRVVAQASAASLRSSVDRVAVVVKPGDQPIINLFQKEHVGIISCSESRLGIGHSIACGIHNTKHAAAWIIALADMPFIKASTVQQIVSALTNGALIAAPVYHGTRGHPVGFSRELYPELVQLTGDIGARELIRRYRSRVVEISCRDPGVIIDIDTPEDLKELGLRQ